MTLKKAALAGIAVLLGLCGGVAVKADINNLDEAEIVVGEHEIKIIHADIQTEKNGLVVKSGGKATVQGNIEAQGFGVMAEACEVTIYGNVSGKTAGVHAYRGVNADIYGSICADGVDVDAEDWDYYREYGTWRTTYGEGLAVVSDGQLPTPNRVNVEGDIRATGTGARVSAGTVHINGNVESLMAENALLLLPEETISVEVTGNVVGNDNDSAVFVWNEPTAKWIVRGDVEAKGKQSAIELYGEGREAEELENGPTMFARKLSVEHGSYFKATVHDENGEEIESNALAEAAAKAIWYIVEVNQPTNGQIRVQGTSEKEGMLVAHEGDELTVSVAPEKGYVQTRIDAGSKAHVQANADGTYTVTVERGGDVTISAALEAMPEMPQTGDGRPIGTEAFVLVASAAALMLLRKKKSA